ncbi:MAG TPA: ShlB/FhaC/HecB family hemolysin secretion/activation protein [Steroidobacteraceae bacterium]|nr:ShlB/FhaC/HecB family hemolysin secretion/activation protein [Steroidobacteraceae bacterium]
MNTHWSERRCLAWAAVAGLLVATGIAPAVVAETAVAPVDAPHAIARDSASSGQAAAESHFDVFELRVLGNTTLPAVEIERAVYGFLGPGKTIADVEAARQSLERTYHNAGYGSVFVDIPEQQVEEGVVRLRVTEGRLDRIRVTGARYFSNRQIRAALPAVAPGKVLNVPELQNELANVNRLTGDRQVVPVLKAGQTPGAVDLELKVNDTLPLHGSVEVNNRYSAGTPRTRVSGTLAYSNLFDAQQAASLQYQTAPEDPAKVKAGVATYMFRLADLPQTTFTLYAVNSQTDVAALGTLSVLGNGHIYGTRAIQALPSGQNFVNSLTFGVDYKDFLENIQISSTESQVTPIHYLNWSLAYAATLSSSHASTDFSVAANFGVRRFVNETEEFENKRFTGAPNYFYVRASAQQVYRLSSSWELYGGLTGQVTEDPLVSNEQLAIGGADTVRGYLEASVLGDYGLYGSVEIRQLWPTRLFRLSGDPAYFFVFYDAGLVNIYDPLPGQISRATIASFGAGLHVGAWHGLSLDLDWARALKDAPSVQQGDSRALLDMRYAF